MCCKVKAFCRFTVFALALVSSSQAAKSDPGVVSREDLVKFGPLAWTIPNFEIPKMSPGLPVLDPADNSPEATLLRRLEQQGRLGGFDNVIYDNHDRGHSLPETGAFPRVPQLYFEKELRKHHLD